MRRSVLLFAAAVGAMAALAEAEAATHYGGDAGGLRYVAAEQITPANVGQLVRAWVTRTGHASSPAADEARFSATPILVEGKLALCTPFNVMMALDPGTGRELWRYDAQVNLEAHPGNGYNCRGVSYWRDAQAPREAACSARLYMGTVDHRLIAVDLATGAPCAGFGEGGTVAIDPEMTLRWPGEFQITSPPVILGDVVIVGSSISDNGRREAPIGSVRAFDARTGAPRWSFDPIPRDAARARAQGWEDQPVEGHANVWAPMATDEARGLVFLPTSSPSPDFFGGMRPGDNRNANSVVALEAATGRVRWAFQTVHHDVWDYDIPAQPMLATITKDGAARDVVIQVTKTGLVFTLDRDTGEPVFAVEERPVPQGGAAGEALSPTQPFPVAPQPLAPSRIAPEDAWGVLGFDRAACRDRIAGARAEGLYTPPSTQGTILHPFTGGGANWGGAAYDPATNRLYVNTASLLHLIKLIPRDRVEPREEQYETDDAEFAPMRGTPYAMTREVMLSPIGLPCNPPPWGSLYSVDMGTGEVAWRANLGTTEDLAPLGLALRIGTPNIGGPLVTRGGLVFIGAAMDRYLRAFDAQSGRELWQGRLPAGGQATPMSYEWEGRQYVVIAAGGHDDMGTAAGDSIVAFTLPREGEPGPSLWSRTIDRPGGRFAALMTGAGIALIGLVGGFLLRRRRKQRAA